MKEQQLDSIFQLSPTTNRKWQKDTVTRGRPFRRQKIRRLFVEKIADFSSKKSPAYRRLINDISPTYRQKIDTYRRKKSPTICRIIAYLSPIYLSPT
jgi:hypothetical protein